MKARIINVCYVYGGDGKLYKLDAIKKPWRLYTDGRVKHFRTHAEAIHQAHKHARKGKK